MPNTNHFSGYKGIFKSTFLFGFVQIFKMIIGIVNNKVAALFLGAEGIGLMGIFTSTISLIQTGAGLGVSQSSVRDVSQAFNSNDTNKFSRVIFITNRILIFTSLLGLLITIFFSKYISIWTLGNESYILAFAFLSVAVAAQIYSEGQLAILKGMRQLNALARASIFGSIVGFVTVIPLYYFFRKDGIVPSLIVTSLASLVFSYIYVRRIKFKNQILTVKEQILEAKPMIRMGIALMFVSFLWTIVALVISSFIRQRGGIIEVGYYQAGTTILSRYFGVIITALSTDYYPRIAAINSDNQLVEVELNKQSSVSLILVCPLIVVFLFFLPYIVPLLYSSEFGPTVEFIKYAIFGTLITIVSNQVDMILVAKFQIRIFTFLAVLIRLIQIVMTLFLYNSFGLIGLGLSFTIVGFLHLVFMTYIVYRYYKISFNRFFVKRGLFVLLFSFLTLFCSSLDFLPLVKWPIGLILILSSAFYSYYVSKHDFDIDFLRIVRVKLFPIKK